MRIVTDCAAHAAEVAEITRAAFKRRYGTGDAEAAIVEALRRAADVVLELAAVEKGEIVGHAMFSRATARPPLCRIAALGPVAVRVDRQRRGIGDSLIRAGLAACGVGAVVVLGDPGYYGRFGFRVLPDVECVYAGPHFQAVELNPGALNGVKSVAYAPAFQSPAL